MPVAIITGITGQDGSYLAELLLGKGYQVIGMVRRSSTVTMERLQHIQDDIIITQGDLHDQSSMVALIEEYKPDEVYNLAAQSFVKCLKTKTHPSTRVLLIALPNFTGIGSQSITANRSTCSPARASCSTTKARAAAWNL